MSDRATIPFQQVVDALLNVTEAYPATKLYRLSNLNDDESRKLVEIWEQISVDRRRTLLSDLEEFAERDPLLFFETVGRIGLNDSDAQVRLHAIGLTGMEEDPKLIARFSTLLKNDPDADVRAAAASALGTFVYLGEIDELAPETFKKIEDLLLQTLRGQEPELVRRRALEAVSYSSRPEISDLIATAFSRDDENWQASAVFAMGRSANGRWSSDVSLMIDSENHRLRREAILAAGELDIQELRPVLFEIVEGEDEELREAAIWALSQIGGEGVGELLEELQASTEDEEELEFLEAALDNLYETETLDAFDLFGFEDDGDPADEVNGPSGEE